MASKKGNGNQGKPERDLGRDEVQNDLKRLFLPLPGALGDEDDAPDELLAELLNEVKGLRQDQEAVWVVATQRIENLPIRLDPIEPGSLHALQGGLWITMVLDARSGGMIGIQPVPDLTYQDVAGVLLSMMAEPAGDTAPMRPSLVLTEDQALAEVLQTKLAEVGVKVNREDLPGLGEALTGLIGEMQSELVQGTGLSQGDGLVQGLRGGQVWPYLSDLSAEQVQAVQLAFSRFMTAAPWKVFLPQKPIYATWRNPDGSQGQMYATVMGELGQEFGLALYPDWNSFSRHLNNAYNPDLALEATGGLEAITLSDPADLHPDDLKALQAAGLSTKKAPGLLRIGPEGTQPPLTPVGPLTAVLNMFAARAELRANTVSSYHADQGGVQLRYPGGPRDELNAAELAGSVRLTVRYSPVNSATGVELHGGEVVLMGPADMLLRKAMRDLGKWLDEWRLRLNGEVIYTPYRLQLPGELPDSLPESNSFFWPTQVNVWDADVRGPDLTLAHLARLGLVHDNMAASIEAQWQPGALSELSIVSDLVPAKKLPETEKKQGKGRTKK